MRTTTTWVNIFIFGLFSILAFSNFGQWKRKKKKDERKWLSPRCLASLPFCSAYLWHRTTYRNVENNNVEIFVWIYRQATVHRASIEIGNCQNFATFVVTFEFFLKIRCSPSFSHFWIVASFVAWVGNIGWYQVATLAAISGIESVAGSG